MSLVTHCLYTSLHATVLLGTMNVAGCDMVGFVTGELGVVRDKGTGCCCGRFVTLVYIAWYVVMYCQLLPDGGAVMRLQCVP